MDELLLLGAGGHALSCIDVIERSGRYRIAGLVGMPSEVGSEVLGYRVLASDDDLPALVARYRRVLVAVGHIRSPAPRVRLFERARELGGELPVVIAPGAEVSSHAVIGDGSIIMHGAIVNAKARIGCNVIINSRALIEHGTVVGDHCHISTGAIVNGDVSVGERSFVGSGSVIREGIAVGRDCIIGMGLALRHSQPDNTRFTGRKTGGSA